MDLQSILGYSLGSPYANQPFLDINTPEGLIDMSNTPIDLWGIDNKGNKKKMKAFSKNPYKFEGDIVREIKMQEGGFNLLNYLMDDEEDYLKQYEDLQEDSLEVNPAPDLNFEKQVQNLKIEKAIGNEVARKKYNGQILSSGKFGDKNIGEYGREIYGQLANDLGYSPVVNSIYRSPDQQKSLISKGLPAAKNSWHLSGNAVDLKPADWNKLSADKRNFYKNNYDVVYHNNHYHIEPKGNHFEKTDKGKYAFNYLQQKHNLPPHVAAGIVGNFIQESGNFRDDVISDQTTGDNDLDQPSHGIAQWRGERWDNMKNWAVKNKMNPFTLNAQLDFAIHEANQRGDLSKVMTAKNSTDAANIFAKYYERPKVIDPNRAKYANKYHPYKYGGIYEELLNK